MLTSLRSGPLSVFMHALIAQHRAHSAQYIFIESVKGGGCIGPKAILEHGRLIGVPISITPVHSFGALHKPGNMKQRSITPFQPSTS